MDGVEGYEKHWSQLHNSTAELSCILRTHCTHLLYFNSLVLSVNLTCCISHGLQSPHRDPEWGAESHERWLSVSIVFVFVFCKTRLQTPKWLKELLRASNETQWALNMFQIDCWFRLDISRFSDYYVFSRSWFGHCPPLRFIVTVAISSAPIMLHYPVTRTEIHDKETIISFAKSRFTPKFLS